ncbi:MAG: hypothetical protein ACI83B_003545 [Sediminicola sp.]|jgi:hypothetical protein
MKNNLFLIILFFLYQQNAKGQNYIDENYDCELLNWKIELEENPTAVETALKDVECLIIRNQYQKGIKLLDSLIVQNTTNTKLYHIKTHFQVNHNIYDTTYFKNLRLALSLGSAPDTSMILYNLGVYYLNFLVACNDSNSPVTIEESQFLNLIDRAENYAKESSTYNKEYIPDYYGFKFIVKETRSNYLNIPLQPLSYNDDFDTILIMSELRDCGEFGGHIEYIKCYQKNGEIKGEFWAGPTDCKYEAQNENNQEFKFKPQNISKVELKKYINHVLSIEKNPSSWTNAPTSFWVIIDGEPFFILDWSGNSVEYEKFRNMFFKI